jgi:two-component system OmpR family response regulator
MHAVLVIDAQPTRGVYTAAPLVASGYRTTFVSSPAEAVERSAGKEHALIVFNLERWTPTCHGVVKALLRQLPLPLILLLPPELPDIYGDVYAAGATDTLVRPFIPVQLLKLVREVLQRPRSLPDTVTLMERLWSVNRPQRLLSRRGVPVDLSATEFALLERLILARGGPVPASLLASAMFGDPKRHESREVATVVRGLRRKLEAHTLRLRALQSESNWGYRLKLDP